MKKRKSNTTFQFCFFFLQQQRTTPYFVTFQSYSDDINFKVPLISQYILERNFNALLKSELYFVHLVGKRGSSSKLSTPTLATFASFFFYNRPTPYFVTFQSYSDVIYFTVTLICQYILERNFIALLENRVHLINIVGKGAQIYACRHPP